VEVFSVEQGSSKRTNERTHKCTNAQMYTQTNERKKIQWHARMHAFSIRSGTSHGTKGRTNEEMNGRANERKNELTDEAERTNHRKKNQNNRTDEERFSTECQNTQKKVITLANHSSNQMQVAVTNRGITFMICRDWF